MEIFKDPESGTLIFGKHVKPKADLSLNPLSADSYELSPLVSLTVSVVQVPDMIA